MLVRVNACPARTRGARDRLHKFKKACFTNCVKWSPAVRGQTDDSVRVLEDDCDGWYTILGHGPDVYKTIYDEHGEYRSFIMEACLPVNVRIPWQGSGASGADATERSAYKETIREKRIGQQNRLIERSVAYAADDVPDKEDEPVIKHRESAGEIEAVNLAVPADADRLTKRPVKHRDKPIPFAPGQKERTFLHESVLDTIDATDAIPDLPNPGKFSMDDYSPGTPFA